MINDTLFDVFNVIIKDKNKFPELTDALKEKYIFIINRYLSKRYNFAIELNHKKVDKVTAFDLWYYFLYDKPYPKWVWSKGEKVEVEKELSDKERNLLTKFYDINDHDLDFLIMWEPKQIKEDLKYLIQIEKQK